MSLNNLLSFDDWTSEQQSKHTKKAAAKGYTGSLKDKSEKSGVDLSILQKVYNRGIGAYKTNPSSVRPNVKSKEQWAHARVNSFLTGGKTRTTADKDLWDEHLKQNESLMLNEKASGTAKPRFETYANWYELVNMSASEIEKFLKSEEGDEAGMEKDDAKKEGIHTGSQSAKWLIKMIPIGNSWESAKENWSPEMWYWAGRQISFISRMRGNDGPLEKDGKKTPKHTSLLIWGHNPKKNLRKKPKQPESLKERTLFSVVRKGNIIGFNFDNLDEAYHYANEIGMQLTDKSFQIWEQLHAFRTDLDLMTKNLLLVNRIK
jgi:hypothetical protein